MKLAGALQPFQSERQVSRSALADGENEGVVRVPEHHDVVPDIRRQGKLGRVQGRPHHQKHRFPWPPLGSRDLTMYLRTVLVEWVTPSFKASSLAIRSSPPSGWSVLMRRMKAMCSAAMRGRRPSPGRLGSGAGADAEQNYASLHS